MDKCIQKRIEKILKEYEAPDEKKLKDIKRITYDPTEPRKDFPPHYERHRPRQPGVKRILEAK